MQIYFNGELVASQTTAGPLLANTPPLTIGLSDKHGFYGLIDEPAVYNRALSPAEIQAIFKAGSAGKRVPGAGEGQKPKALQQAGVSAGFFLLMALKRHHARDGPEKKANNSWRDFSPDFALKTPTRTAEG
jgi:hypothetical protein